MKNYEKNNRVFIYDLSLGKLYEGIITDTKNFPSTTAGLPDTDYIEVKWKDDVVENTEKATYNTYHKYFRSFKNNSLYERYMIHYDKEELKKCVYDQIIDMVDNLTYLLRKLKKYENNNR